MGLSLGYFKNNLVINHDIFLLNYAEDSTFAYLISMRTPFGLMKISVLLEEVIIQKRKSIIILRVKQHHNKPMLAIKK
jgi:hypothetical protein